MKRTPNELNYLKNELKHSVKRLKERYDADLSKEDVGEVCKIIRSPNMRNKLLLKQQGKHTMWLIMYKGRLMRPVYNEETCMTTTFLEVFVTHEIAWKQAELASTGSADTSLGSVARITKWK